MLIRRRQLAGISNQALKMRTWNGSRGRALQSATSRTAVRCSQRGRLDAKATSSSITPR